MLNCGLVVKSRQFKIRAIDSVLISSIPQNQQGQRGAKNPGDREDQGIIVSSNTGSASTIEDAALRTKLILDELTTNAFNLIQNLWKIQTCN